MKIIGICEICHKEVLEGEEIIHWDSDNNLHFKCYKINNKSEKKIKLKSKLQRVKNNSR